MDLSASWDYIKSVADQRLEHNRTQYHVLDYGTDIELLGAAGELVARRTLDLPEVLQIYLDGGIDFVWGGNMVDVKTTKATRFVDFRFLQWPEKKPIVAEIVVMTVVNLRRKRGYFLGWATREDIEAAPINRARKFPCHEIPLTKLRPLVTLLPLEYR